MDDVTETTRDEEATSRGMSHELHARWMETRRKGIGGSDAGTIMGCNPWDSVFALWSKKVGLLVEEKQETEAMEWGNRLEDAVATKFFEETCLTEPEKTDAIAGVSATAEVAMCEPGILIFRHKDYHWMMATPDRFVLDGGGRLGILEVKTASRERLSDWEDGKPPSHYYAQLQHYLAVLGLQFGYFAVLFGGQRFVWLKVERDDDFISDLVQAEWAFWAKVSSESPPEADDSPATERALKSLYPDDSGETAQMPDDADAWDDELQAINEQLRALKEHKRALETRIKASIGSATYGTLPSGIQYSLKRVDVPERVAKAYSFRKLVRLKPKRSAG